jgi:ABC-type Fe3+-hydroxamate transport system substrate-binding protein
LAYALNDFKNFIKDKPLKVAYFIWKNPYMVAGSDNFINELLKLNHFKIYMTIIQRLRRYPEIELDKMKVEGDPEIVFFLRAFPFKKEEDGYEIDNIQTKRRPL